MKTIKVGRSSECDIVLTYDKISRVHAIISFNGGQYIYQDISRNGSNIGGRIVTNEKLIIAPGTTVLLANKVPLPWEQVYTMLSPKEKNVNLSGTMIEENQPFIPNQHYSDNHQKINIQSQTYQRDELGVGWGILAFLIPLTGWIMYFSWKDRTPNRAKWAGIIGLISFGIGILEAVLICFQNFLTAIFEAIFSMICRDSSGLQLKNQRKKSTKRVVIKCWKEIKTAS